MVIGWLRGSYGLVMSWSRVVGWLQVVTRLRSSYLRGSYGLVIGWLCDADALVTGWLRNGYGVVTG